MGEEDVVDLGEGLEQIHLEPRAPATPRRAVAQVDDDMSSIKCIIPPFHGRNNPDEFITWSDKVDLAFSFQNFSDYKQMRMVLLEFHDYATTWWKEF